MNPAPVALPPDDLRRGLAFTQGATGNRPHIGVVGDTYTILVTGEETAGKFCVIDMFIPPGGGPPPHRHDFEETFIMLEGELQLTFRGETHVAKAGDTITIPANAPHHFRNVFDKHVRMLCICAPAGLENFFLEVGVPVATRTTPPPHLDEAGMEAFKAKAGRLAPKYRTELLRSV